MCDEVRTRVATQEEIDAMPAHVRWLYDRGLPVTKMYSKAGDGFTVALWDKQPLDLPVVKLRKGQ